ncbi:MAG: hypothetical protein AB7S77_15960 [Desulfatirhabdiaceae bacterium]
MKTRYHVIMEGGYRLLAILIALGLAGFILYSIPIMLDMNWSETETFYELFYRVLLTAIGIELIHTLVTHDLNAIVEMIAMVIARKLLKPDSESADILLIVIAFCLLLGARKYFLDLSSICINLKPVPGDRKDV